MSNKTAETQPVLTNKELSAVVKKILDAKKQNIEKKLTKTEQELLSRAQQTGSPTYIFLFLVKMGYDLNKWDSLWFPKNSVCALFKDPHRIRFRYADLKVIRGYFKNPHSIATTNPSEMTPWD